MKSARILGQELGLTAQEMNHALKEAGFLSGEPGAYSVTEKGAKFVAEKYHERGTGGYAHYNRAWETRSWDDSVVSHLNLSDDRKRQIRQAVSEARRTARAARSAAVVVADTPPATVPTTSAREAVAVLRSTGTGRAMLVAAAAYGGYRAAPLVQKLWNEKAAPGLENLRDRVWPRPDAREEAATDGASVAHG